PLKERVSGIDLFLNLVKNAQLRNETIFLLGAEEKVVRKVAETFKKDFGEGIIAGYHHGYFSKEDEDKLVKQIVDSKATYLYVAMSSPKKEIFLSRYKQE